MQERRVEKSGLHLHVRRLKGATVKFQFDLGISVQADRATERSMLEVGAAAFAPKSRETDQIINTILQVNGDRFQSGK